MVRRRMPLRTLLPLAAALLVAALPSPAAAHDLASPAAWPTFRSVARAAANAPEPSAVATPKAQCRPGSKPEPGLQGRVAKEDVDSGKAAEG